jgi:glycerol-3-phosphate dehydrogenase (NAD(P)+)
MSAWARSGACDDLNIAILGAGAWGTALSVSLSQKHAVTLWSRDAAQAKSLSELRRNSRYLSEVPLPPSVAVTDDLLNALKRTDLVLIATPVGALREVLSRLPESRALPVIWACKGFEHGSARMPHEVVAEVLRGRSACGALSGPSFAQEVARGLPTALTLASFDPSFARDTAKVLHQPALRVYYSDDLIGAEVGGAVKNVMAIATGICDGMGLGLNARAALITRGLAEIVRLGIALGARSETLMGLTGAGDLILTCTGELSRNRRVGLELAKGRTLEQVLAQLGHVAEGVESAREVARIAAERNIDMPITASVCAVLFGGVTPDKAVQQLLSRDPGTE